MFGYDRRNLGLVLVTLLLNLGCLTYVHWVTSQATQQITEAFITSDVELMEFAQVHRQSLTHSENRAAYSRADEAQVLRRQALYKLDHGDTAGALKDWQAARANVLYARNYLSCGSIDCLQ